MSSQSITFTGAVMLTAPIIALLFSQGSAWAEEVSSEAPSHDTFQIWMVIFCCIFFCIAVRHINDFYAGDTVTLVKEGTWGGRFKHHGENRQMSAVEQNFAIMYEKMRVAERNAARHQQRYRPIG